MSVLRGVYTRALGVAYEPISSPEKEALLANRPESFMVFKEGTELALALFVERHAKDSPFPRADMVQRAIDVFCYSRHWMMHMGDLKLPIAREAVALARANNSDTRPGQGLVCVEMGTYCGYSAVALSQMLQLAPRAPAPAPAPAGGADGGSSSGSGSEVLITFEKNAKAAEVSARILAAAGLTDCVTTHVCEAGSGAALHAGTIRPGSVGLLFLDHEKTAYPADLCAWMESGLLAPRCVVLADNIHFQDCPHEAYLSLVRDPARGFASSSFYASLIEYTTHSEDVSDLAHPLHIRDGMELSVLA